MHLDSFQSRIRTTYSYGLSKEIANQRLNPRRQWQQRQQQLRANTRLDLQPAEQLQRGNTSRHPGDVHLRSRCYKQTLIVVAPRDGRDGGIAAGYVRLVKARARFRIEFDQIVIATVHAQIVQLAIGTQLAIAIPRAQCARDGEQLTRIAPLHDHAEGAIKAGIDMCG